MHLLLTDRLTCPRCGPTFGLILLADRVEHRRVLAGRLGCPNCREKYPVDGGFCDLRAPPRHRLAAQPDPSERTNAVPSGATRARDSRGPTSATAGRRGPAGAPEPGRAGSFAATTSGPDEAAVRLAALLGVRRGPGFILLAGEPVQHASTLAGLLEDVEVVAVGPELRAIPESMGVSRMVAAPGLPLYDGTLRGVGLGGDEALAWLSEAVRVLGRGGRLVVEGADAGARTTLEAEGLEILVDERGVIVARKA